MPNIAATGKCSQIFTNNNEKIYRCDNPGADFYSGAKLVNKLGLLDQALAKTGLYCNGNFLHKFFLTKRGQTEPNRARRSQTGPNRAKRSQSGPNRAKQGQTGPNGTHGTKQGPSGPNEPIKAKLCQSVPNGAKPCLMGQMGPYQAHQTKWGHTGPNQVKPGQTSLKWRNMGPKESNRAK